MGNDFYFLQPWGVDDHSFPMGPYVYVPTGAEGPYIVVGAHGGLSVLSIYLSICGSEDGLKISEGDLAVMMANQSCANHRSQFIKRGY